VPVHGGGVRGDLKHVGDVRHLKGRAIEVSGTIQDYDGRAEIILRRPRQLGKDAALVPPLPKTYDVERRANTVPGNSSIRSCQEEHRKQGPSGWD